MKLVQLDNNKTKEYLQSVIPKLGKLGPRISDLYTQVPGLFYTIADESITIDQLYDFESGFTGRINESVIQEVFNRGEGLVIDFFQQYLRESSHHYILIENYEDSSTDRWAQKKEFAYFTIGESVIYLLWPDINADVLKKYYYHSSSYYFVPLLLNNELAASLIKKTELDTEVLVTIYNFTPK